MEIKNKAAQKLGKRGGKKTASLYGKEHFSKIAKGWPKGKKRKKILESSYFQVIYYVYAIITGKIKS